LPAPGGRAPIFEIAKGFFFLGRLVNEVLSPPATAPGVNVGFVLPSRLVHAPGPQFPALKISRGSTAEKFFAIFPTVQPWDQRGSPRRPLPCFLLATFAGKPVRTKVELLKPADSGKKKLRAKNSSWAWWPSGKTAGGVTAGGPNIRFFHHTRPGKKIP